MPRFIINGGRRLKGEVTVSGSKNAALPILAASLLTDKPCIIKNVPDIEDIRTMIAILRSLGSKVSFQNHIVHIHTPHIKRGLPPSELGCKMRASVLLLGPLLARTGRAHLPYPGGCILGARPVNTHIDVFLQMGVRQASSKKDEIKFEGKPKPSEVVLPEFSVTGTENALMAAALTKGKTIVRMAAIEPHVQDLCRFLKALGVSVKGAGTHTVEISRGKNLKGISYSITPDYLEAGTFVIASILTRGSVVVRNIAPHDLDAFWNLLKEMKVNFKLAKNSVQITPSKEFFACRRLQTNVFPGFPTDLQPPFTVLLTQAKGLSRIHETLFEGRFNYFPEMIKMGAKIEKLNPHEAVVKGPVQLRGTSIKSWDIRAGAAMILAALAAKGKTEVSDIHYIDRGYERFDEKLRALGADIRRLD